MHRIALIALCWVSVVPVVYAQPILPIPIRAAVPNVPRETIFPARLKQRFRIPDRSPVTGLAFVPGRNAILVLQESNLALLLNPQNGQILGQWKGEFFGSLRGGLAVAPDGKHAAFGTLQRVHYLALPDMKEVWVFHPDVETPRSAFQQLAFSPDGKRLAASGYGWPVHLLDTADGSSLQTEKSVVNSLRMLRFARDGQSLFMAGAASTDGVPPPIPHAARWNLNSGTVDLLERWPQRTVAYALWEQPDGQLALHGSQQSGIRHLDPQTLAVTSTTPFMSGWAAAISGDGRRYAFSSQSGIVRMYDSTLPDAKLGTFSLETQPEQLALNHDGTELLVGANNGDIQWWRLRFPRTGEEPASAVDLENLFATTDLSAPQVSEADDEGVVRFEGHRGNILTVTAYPDNEHVLTTGFDQRVLLWNLSTRKLDKRFDGVAGKAFDLYFGARASVDGKQLLLAGGQYRGTHHLDLWNPLTLEKQLGLGGVTDTTWKVAFSADGALCAAGGNRHDLVVWDTKTGDEKVRIPIPANNQNNLGFHAVDFATDGKHLVSSFGTSVSVWSVESGKLVSSVETGQCLAMAARPDADEIFIDTGRGGQFYTVPKLEGRRIVPAQQHIRHITFSADGNRLLIGDRGECSVWDLPSSERVFQRTGKMDVISMTPDGKTLLFSEASTLAALPLP